MKNRFRQKQYLYPVEISLRILQVKKRDTGSSVFLPVSKCLGNSVHDPYRAPCWNTLSSTCGQKNEENVELNFDELKEVTWDQCWECWRDCASRSQYLLTTKAWFVHTIKSRTDNSATWWGGSTAQTTMQIPGCRNAKMCRRSRGRWTKGLHARSTKTAILQIWSPCGVEIGGENKDTDKWRHSAVKEQLVLGCVASRGLLDYKQGNNPFRWSCVLTRPKGLRLSR